ncbi:MAG: YeeE/YedE thiosulfate transporter family protein [Bacteroidota bacterium]
MNYLKFLLTGVFFGIIMAKAEIISWYRIYEMFRFESFHMYGIIGSAVILGVGIVQWIKRKHLKGVQGQHIAFTPKKMSVARYLLGGSIFGLGWALSGACPGPMFVLVGYGYWTLLLVIFGALLGTFTYGVIRDRLPH